MKACCVASVTLVLSHVETAHAQPKPPATGAGVTPAQSDEARAQDLFKSSAESYRRGDFKQSVRLLIEAYALQPEPVLLYNLGRAYEGLGDKAHALDAYKRYLRDDAKAPDGGAIAQRIVTLQREIDELAALEKERDDERKRAEAQPPKNEKPPPAPPQKPSTLPYVVGGVGVAGLGSGLVFGLLSGSSHDSAVSEPTQKKASDLQSRAHTFATVSTVSFIAGGALVATGAVLWVLDSRKRSAAVTVGGVNVDFSVGPGSVGAAGTF